MPRLRNSRHERFCWLFVFGHPKYDPRADREAEGYVPDTVHNGTKSYEWAGYRGRGQSAAVNASKLLRREDVQLRIFELEEQAEKAARLEAFRWARHMPQVHRLIRKALAGEEIPSSTVQIVKLAVDRSEGPLQYRFTDPRTGATKEGIPVFVYGQEDGYDDPPPGDPPAEEED